ncbi:MAG TPA: hypothetical protein VLX92_12855 [Kofleriaceae bacterium]|nr:hypothetical protein [Kofleriaceae bacterium]
MTYRDDHDAALHRIAALEDELARSEADRRRLEAALVKAPAPTPLAQALDVERLVARVRDQAVREASAMIAGAVVACGLLAAWALGAFAVGAVHGGAVATGLLAILAVTAALVDRRPGPHDLRAICNALRTAPERVVSLDHRIDDGERIQIATASATLSFASKDRELYTDLRRRCPNAPPRGA